LAWANCASNELRLEDADLLFGDPDTSGVVLQRGLLLANVGLR
jgi:hypothetical protein